MGAVKNAFHDEICRAAYFAELGRNEASECEDCDGFGMCWNNADPTSGQWHACETCGDERGYP
jgi:hypothetical protein